LRRVRAARAKRKSPSEATVFKFLQLFAQLFLSARLSVCLSVWPVVHWAAGLRSALASTSLETRAGLRAECNCAQSGTLSAHLAPTCKGAAADCLWPLAGGRPNAAACPWCFLRPEQPGQKSCTPSNSSGRPPRGCNLQLGFSQSWWTGRSLGGAPACRPRAQLPPSAQAASNGRLSGWPKQLTGGGGP